MFKLIFGMILGAVIGTVAMIIISCLVVDARLDDEEKRKSE